MTNLKKMDEAKMKITAVRSRRDAVNKEKEKQRIGAA